MPNRIQHLRSSTSGVVPAASGLSQGELAINIADGKFYTKNNANAVINLGVTSISGTTITPASGSFNTVIFNNVENDNLTQGQLAWNSTYGTIEVGLESDHKLHIGQETNFRVRNSTGETLYKGQAVSATGIHNDNIRLLVNKYVADGSTREVRFIGLISETIDNTESGLTTSFGYIRGSESIPLDTRGNVFGNIATGDETWLQGDILYVHPTVAGKLTKVEPKHSISVAIVVRVHRTEGVLLVRPTSYGHLNDNHDVNVSGVSNNQYLRYDSISDTWLPTSSGIFNNIYASGNVGIGVVEPSGKLDVNGTAYFGTAATANNVYFRTGQSGISETALKLRTDVFSNLYLDASSAYVKVGNQSADVDIIAGNAPVRIGNSTAQTAANQYVMFKPANSEAMRITSDGKVGIGTTSPSSMLDIRTSGNPALIVRTNNGQNTFQYLKSDNTNLLRASFDGSNFHHYLDARLYYNIGTYGVAFDGGGGTNQSQVSVGNRAYIALNSITTSAPGNANIYAGPTAYAAVDNQLTNISPIAIKTWAWNGSDGFTLGSVGYIKQTQNSANNGDARLSVVRGTDNTEILVIDYLQSNVGIGTTIPQSGFKLDINGSSVTRGNILTNGSIQEFANDRFKLNSASASNSHSYVSFGGANFGVGTNSPTTKLDVSGVITATSGNSTNWNTAFGWGNHASAGYLSSLEHNHGIANSAGTQQFTFGVNDNIRFAGSGATSVAFNSGTKLITISSTDTNTTYSGSTSVILSGSSFERAALSGDITAAQNNNSTTIANDAVTNAKMANMAVNTIKGRITTGTGDPEDLTAANVRTIINVADGANNYVHPTDGANTTITAANLKVLSAITVNSLGHVTSVSSKNLIADDIPDLPWSKITSGKPTTLSGYGITDALASSLKGANNGLAELDNTGKVPSSQLPSYVDDVLEYATTGNFPITGETGKIYVATGTNLTYRWSGSSYVEISASLALGETSSTAYRGDRGKEAYDHSQLTTGSVHGSTTVGGNLLRLTNPSVIRFLRVNADNTVSALSDSDFRTAIGAGTSSTTGTVTSISGTGSVAGITLSGTVTSTGSLTLGGSLSSASSSAVGGIKLGSDTVQNIGANSVTATTSRTYAVQLNGTGQAVINIPWVDTTYTASSGIVLNGTVFSHVDTSSQSSVDNSDGNVIQDITLDTYGHITALGSVNLDSRYLGKTVGLWQTTSDNAERFYFVSNGKTLYKSPNGHEFRHSDDNETFTISVSGNCVAAGNVTSTGFIKSGGTSSQFLKADGSVDSTAYTTNTGTVTSVAALTLGTTGTDVSSTVANSTTTPVITLNIPTASASNRGALSSTDWTTFNNKQAALTNPVTGTGTTNYVSKWTSSSAQGNSLIFDNGTSVGIGTATPSGNLNVHTVVGADYGQITCSVSAITTRTHINIGNSDTKPFLASVNGDLTNSIYGWGFFDRGADGDFRLARKGGTTSWIDCVNIQRTNGNVGIGSGTQVTSPAERLVVDGNLRLADTAGSIGNRLQFYRGGGSAYDYTISKESNHLAISTANDGTTNRHTQFGYHSGTTWVPKTVINNYDGSLGVGTTSPSEILTVYGDSKYLYIQAQNNSGTAGIKFGNTAARQQMYIEGTSHDLVVDSMNGGVTESIRIGYNTGAVTINESGSDLDFRIEGDSDPNLFFVDASTDRVGIGTNAPSHRLQLGNNTATSTATPEIISLGGTFSNTAGANAKLRLWTNGSDLMGLGVSTSQLDYVCSSNFSHVFYNNGSETWRITSDGILQSNGAKTIQTSTGNLTLATAAGNGNIILSPNGTGKVGIGITSPAGNLDIKEALVITTTGKSRATFFNFSGNYANILTDPIVIGTNETTARPIAINYYQNTPGIVISTSGNVGIGISAPTTTLHTKGTIRSEAVGNSNYLQLNHSGSEGVISTDNGSFSFNPANGIAYLFKSGSNGQFRVYGSGGSSNYVTLSHDNNDGSITTAVGDLVLNSATGKVGVGTSTPTYTLQVNGSFGATTKSFRIDHPSRPDYTLEYGSLESPYHGVRLTGRGRVVKGVCVVDLPSYLKDLIHDDENINIQLTNHKHGKTLYIDKIDLQNDQFIVRVDRAKTLPDLEFFWTFTGVRKDVESLVVEKEK